MEMLDGEKKTDAERYVRMEAWTKEQLYEALVDIEKNIDECLKTVDVYHYIYWQMLAGTLRKEIAEWKEEK